MLRPVSHDGRLRPSHDRARPRILHVINSLGPGGAERSLAELLGLDSVITCLKASHEGFQDLVEAGSVDLRFVGRPSLPGAVVELRDSMRTKSVDLVHTTLFEADIAGRLAHRSRPCSSLTGRLL